jgi:hypothetical protein
VLVFRRAVAYGPTATAHSKGLRGIADIMKLVLSMFVTSSVFIGVLSGVASVAPNPDSAAGRCGPPGQSIGALQKAGANPEDFGYKSWGEAVKTECAPGQQ